MSFLALLLLSAPAPKVAPPSRDALVGAWRATYRGIRGTLTLRRDGIFGLEADGGSTITGEWSLAGGTLRLCWRGEYIYPSCRRVCDFGGATDVLVQQRRGVWGLYKGSTPSLILRERLP